MRYYHYLIIFMMCLLAGIILGFLYWMFEGTIYQKVLDKQDIIFQTTKNEYRPGETVEASFTVCKFRSINPTIQWSLVDTYLRIYPSRHVNSNIVGCFKDKIVQIEDLPKNITPDTYHFSGTLVYQLNPLKQIVVTMRSNEFRIVNP